MPQALGGVALHGAALHGTARRGCDESGAPRQLIDALDARVVARRALEIAHGVHDCAAGWRASEGAL